MPARDFDAIYVQYQRLVYWAAYGVTKNHEAALDAVQSVFLRVLEHLNKIEAMEDGQIKGWLYKVAVNSCIDRHRKLKREVLSDVIPDTVSISFDELPEATLLKREQRMAIRNLVDELPDIYRQPLLLYYFANMGYSDIAKSLNMSEGTIKSRMSRAKAMLAKSIAKDGELYGK